MAYIYQYLTSDIADADVIQRDYTERRCQLSRYVATAISNSGHFEILQMNTFILICRDT